MPRVSPRTPTSPILRPQGGGGQGRAISVWWRRCLSTIAATTSTTIPASPTTTTTTCASSLRQLERAHPSWVVDYSPTRRVGHAPISAFPKVERAVPMLSLDNTYSAAELREFDERVRRGLRAAGDASPLAYMLEPKIDGIGIELTYRAGVFTLGDARRWPDWRRRHRQPAHHRRCRCRCDSRWI